MRTSLRFAGLALALAVAVATIAVLVPGLATATSGAPEQPVRSTVSPPAPAAIEPAFPVAAVGMPDANADQPAPAASVATSTTRPAPDTAPRPAPAGTADPKGSVSSPVLPFDPGYWTPERMANAKPAPLPTVP